MTERPHLCFVSDQPVPHLVPLIDAELRGRSVWLLAGPKRGQHAAWLKGTLERLYGQSRVHVETIPDPFDFGALIGQFHALAARFPQGVDLNLTGGTKLMTLAAWEVFRRPDDRLYYVQVHGDLLTWLHPPGLPAKSLEARLTLEPYLAAHGWEISRKNPIQRPKLDPMTLKELDQRRSELDKLPENKRGGDGTWLETYVYGQVSALWPRDALIQDCGFRIHLMQQDGERLYNEIDVAVLRANTLTLIECKGGLQGKGPAGVSCLYKLAALSQRLGGLRHYAVFVTNVNVAPKSGMRARAREWGVTIFDAHDLEHLGRRFASLWASQDGARV